MKQKIKKLFKNVATLFVAFIPINNKKFLFESGRQRIDDNPKYFYLFLKENFKDEYDLKVMAYRGSDTESINPDDVVYYNTLSYYYHLAGSKFLIRSHSINANLKKRKNQVYIQLWHGAEYKNCDIKDFDVSLKPVDHVKEWDLFVANDDFQKEVITRQTGYKGSKVTLGMSRTDYIQQEKNSPTEQLKEELGLPLDKRIVLYAPTFRDWYLDTELELTSVINELTRVIGPDSILLLRLHPLIKNYTYDDSSKSSKVVYDMSGENDLEKVLLVSDLMISDYSTIFYDYALLERPIILYMYDYEEYVEKRGDFYFDIEKDLPAMVAYDYQQLEERFKQIKNTPDLLRERLDIFNSSFNKNNDGNVSRRLLDYIKEYYFN